MQRLKIITKSKREADDFVKEVRARGGKVHGVKKLTRPHPAAGTWQVTFTPPAKDRKGNPMPRKKAKRKATPAQLRNLAKGRKKLAARRKTKKKRATKRNPARGNFLSARNVLKTGRATNPVRPSSKVIPHYAIKSGKRYFDGARFTGKPADAAMWKNLNTCKRVAQSLANATGKDCAIVDMRR